MRFLGLTLGENVLDAKTIWLFRDTLTKATVMPDLFTLFNQILESAYKLCQKDTDARWTKTNNEIHFGYKNHAKLIATYWDDFDAIIYADSAYSGAPISEKLSDNIENRIYQKAYRNHPLNDAQKESNRLKSKVRVRMAHVFGFMTGCMHGLTLRCIGKQRADFNIGLTNLVYNLCRCEVLRRVNIVG